MTNEFDVEAARSLAESPLIGIGEIRLQLTEASDEIESLRGEVERLKSELELAHESIDEACNDGNRNADIGMAWQKKAEMFRTALEIIGNEIGAPQHYHPAFVTNICQIVAAALAGEDLPAAWDRHGQPMAGAPP